MTMLTMRVLLGSALAIWLTARVEPVQGAAVYSDTLLVRGPEYLTRIDLPLNSIGTYKITATDLEWFGAPLQALSFGVFTSTHQMKMMQGPGTLEFFKAGADKIFLQVYARTVGPKFGGLVSLRVEGQAPVPLPASVVLLASALGGSAVLHGAQNWRKRPNRARVAAARWLARVRSWWATALRARGPHTLHVV
jgi:hypothetical protein